MEKILGDYFDMPKNEVQLFENEEFGKIRTLVLNGEPWFVGKDVAEKLGYENQNRDIQRHVDEEDRIMLNSETQYQNGTEFDYKILGQRGGWIINESGLYALIFGSKLESAKRFKHWVTSEVLPAIRKTGSYNLTPQNHMELMFQDMKMEWKLVYAQINNLSDVVEKQNKQFTQVVNNMTLTTVQQRKIYTAGKDRISELLGGAHSTEYKKKSRKYFVNMWNCVKENFDCGSSYKDLNPKDFRKAIQYIKKWTFKE